MEDNQHIWRAWANTLHKWGVGEAAAAILEACGPLTLLGAQALYLGQPLLNSLAPNNQLSALAGMLESSSDTQAFVHFLREANQQ